MTWYDMFFLCYLSSLGRALSVNHAESGDWGDLHTQRERERERERDRWWV